MKVANNVLATSDITAATTSNTRDETSSSVHEQQGVWKSDVKNQLLYLKKKSIRFFKFNSLFVKDKVYTKKKLFQKL